MGLLSFLFSSKNHKSSQAASTSLAYYEEEYEFNTKWVSLDYRGSTANLIQRLTPGDTILLVWSNTPFRDGEQIKVLTSNKMQIGWVPASDYPISDTLKDAVKNHWPVSAKVKKTGKVNDPDNPHKNIWWCVVSVEFKVQYTSIGDEVHMGVYNNRYHSNPNCGTALKRKVPLYVAEQRGRIPCPKCVVVHPPEE